MKKTISQVRQFAGQTFSRSGKLEESDEELQAAERKVEQMKSALQMVVKSMGPSSRSYGQSQDPALREKRLKKIPEYLLGLAFKETHFKEDKDSLFQYVLNECGSTEVDLASEIADHEVKVEQIVLSEFNSVNGNEISDILKAKKHLTKCISDKESANSRYQSLLRQSQLHPGSEGSKVNQAKLELEEAESKTELARDNFAVEMFKLLSKEINFVNSILQYLKLQRAYHESALHVLTDIVPRLEKHINASKAKPMFGYPIDEHLRITGRTIAYPIELCVCALLELGLTEEGLLRIAGGNTRTKRMKLSLDSGMFTLPLTPQYRDVHIIAGVLKSYLRDLPEPLLTNYLYESFILAITNNNTEESRLNALWEVVHRLPESNFNNLRYLIKFLSVLSKNQAVNKMTPSNIAIVVAPNLLRSDVVGAEKTFSMNHASTLNCVVELLVKHADWFFKDDINFFMTFTKEELLPDLYEDGFTPSFGRGIDNKSFNPNIEDFNMTKSMFEYQSNDNGKSGLNTPQKQNHSRSNSHDSSRILVENEYKKPHSNSSDQPSPPPDSPKPIAKRKNKPVAPVPPNFVPPDRSKDQSPIKVEKLISSPKAISKENDVKPKADVDRPDKPPRPAVPDAIKHITGSQTINRSTYKSRQLNRIGNKLSSSRENLSSNYDTDRRNSFENEKHSKINQLENNPVVNCVESIIVQHGTVDKMVVRPENTQENLHSRNNVGVMTSFLPMNPPPLQAESDSNTAKPVKPVAAPRTTILPLKPDSADENETFNEVQLRPKSMCDPASAPIIGNKPAIPERPPMLRPSSFRNSTHKNSSLEVLNVIDGSQSSNPSGETTLERIHSYTVDKQQPQIIQVGASARLSDPAILSPEESSHLGAQRTNSSGNGSQQQVSGEFSDSKSFTSQMRKLSQSEGNILDVPPSPRPYHKLARPQIPAPPPPTAFVPQTQPAVLESTNL